MGSPRWNSNSIPMEGLMLPSEGLENLDDLRYEDADNLNETEHDAERPLTEAKSEVETWKEKSQSEKWKDVMELLAKKEARWDESGDSKIKPLEPYQKEALTESDPREETNPTFLHVLAKSLDTDSLKDIPKDTLQKIIEYLVQHRQSTSSNNEANDSREQPILKVAMVFDNYEFIEIIINQCEAQLPDLLDAQDAADMNSLHHAFKIQLPNAMDSTQKPKQSTPGAQEKRLTLGRTIRIIHGFVQQAKPETIAAQDKEKNTPVHYALDYRLCRMSNTIYGQIVRYMISKGDQVLKKETASQFNGDDESPYLYYLQTEKNWLQQIGQTKKSRVAESTTTKPPKKSGRTMIKEPNEAAGSQVEDFDDFKDEQDDWEGARNKKKYKVLNGQAALTVLLARGKPMTAPRGTTDTTMDDPRDCAPSRRPSTNPPGSLNESVPPSQSLAQIPTQVPAQTGNSTQAKASSGDQATSNGKSVAQSKPNPLYIDPKIAAEGIRDFLKLHYIRTRTDMEAKELLYGKIASDKNLYFDATNHKGKTAEQVVDLIEKLSKPGGFESTLSYVSLPVLSHIPDKPGTNANTYGANEGRQRDGTNQENPTMGRRSLVTVFDKLASANVRVRNILRLHVDDSHIPAHTDAAIERAIRGRDNFSLEDSRKEAIMVELWDWKKIDLSIDVIAFAAPNVTHIHLYWSGNQTVLRGWACPEGIPRLRILKGKLKLVTLHATPGLESRDRMTKMIEQFEKEIKDRTNDEVKVDPKIRIGDSTAGFKSDDDPGGSASASSEVTLHHSWVDRMEDFRSSLMSIHTLLKTKSISPPRIKVALIDDGVDLSNLNTYGNIVEATGLSYYPPIAKTERPWHQSTNDHGTIMANMIVRINPWVSLDVIRIQDGVTYSPGGNTRTIYAASAAKAIKGAVLRKADIISMSWTIKKLDKKAKAASVGTNRGDKSGKPEKKSLEEIAIDALQEAIDEAKLGSILMFCSAADDIEVLAKDTLPFSRAPDYIFRIGAALSKGQRDPASEDPNSMTYFFPGNQVADARNPRLAKKVKYRDGSSVSTALAAGFASLIMYCTNVVKAYHEATTKSTDGRTYTKFNEWAGCLHSHENMRRAFDNVNHKEWTDKKFLPVWRKFGDAAEAIKTASTEKKVEMLEDLVITLCHNLEME